MKKIGIDGRLWFESGVGRYVRNLVRGIEKLELKDEFVIFLTPDVFERVKFNNSRIKKKISKAKWHSFSEQYLFKRELEKEYLDLMHFTYFSYPIFYKAPFVVTIHDLIINHYPTGQASSLPPILYKIKYAGYKKIIEMAVKNSKKIVAPSLATKDEIIKHYHPEDKKIEVIYEGFDSQIRGIKTNKDLISKNYILYVGNAYPHKNLEFLLEAFERLSEKIDIDLVCIGRKDFFYKKLEEKKYKKVYFLHDIDDGMLFRYYTNAKLFVMPSLMEGFGLPILEAMSLSCPVISSDTKALKEIGGNAVLYFNPTKRSELVSLLKKVLNDSNLLKSYSEKGVIQAKKYSWQDCVEKTLNLYESCNSV